MSKYFKQKFARDGYFKIEGVLDKKEIVILSKDIKKSKNVDTYRDRNNKIRRIERIYNKSKNLRKINILFINLIKKYLGIKVLIFKDKFNLKPPGGEGFSSHYDGVFYFIDSKNKKRKGWYEYGNIFLSVLLSLDNSNKRNGTIEIAKAHKNSFNKLLKNTKNDGTPNLLKKIEKNLKFENVNLRAGDILIFKNTCPHRSRKNTSNTSRRILYYTYLSDKFGDQYQRYFKDKLKSKNKTSKSLSGQI